MLEYGVLATYKEPTEVYTRTCHTLLHVMPFLPQLLHTESAGVAEKTGEDGPAGSFDCLSWLSLEASTRVYHFFTVPARKVGWIRAIQLSIIQCTNDTYALHQ